MIYHAIRTDGKLDAVTTTVCGKRGTRDRITPRRFTNDTGEFMAVIGSDMVQGPTCGKCRQITTMMRIRNDR